MSLGVRFVKVVARRLPIPLVRRARPGVDTSDDLPPPRREFIPFSHFGAYSGVFITGEDPFWLLASDHGPAHLYDYSEKNVHAFSPVVGEFKGAHFMTQSKTVRTSH
jgi:cleavage and polyadenylation specificity factor subunit 1